jgi:hypothetical protein
MKSAQDYLSRYVGGRVRGGFNQRVFGYPMPTGQGVSEEFRGWCKADKMIKDGEIYHTHTFPHGCKELSFQYGGSHVCNSCGNKGLSKPWWNIKVMKNEDGYLCVGEGFLDQKTSSNYALGDTKKNAINNYYNLMIS